MSDNTKDATDLAPEPTRIMGRVVSKQLRDNTGAYEILVRMEQAATDPSSLDSRPSDFEELDPEDAAHCVLFWDAASNYLSVKGIRDRAVRANVASIWAHFPAAPAEQWCLEDDDQVPTAAGDLHTLWDDAAVLFDPDTTTTLPLRLSVDVDIEVGPMTLDRKFAQAVASSAIVRTPENGDDDGNFIIEIYVPWHLPLLTGERRAVSLSAAETVKATVRRKSP